MATYSETGSGGAYGAGAATKAYTGGTSNTDFTTKFYKEGAAYVRQPDGTYRREKILEYTEGEWGDGVFLTYQGTSITYGSSTLHPEAYLERLNIIYSIDTREQYYRYLNDVK